MKILFLVNDFVGPQNACIGLAQTLKNVRGHQVMFAIRREFFKKFSNFGFREEEGNLLELIQNEHEEKQPETLQMLVDKIRDFGFVSGISPLEKLRQIERVNLIKTCFEDQLLVFDAQILDILKRINPDLIIYDGEVIPPAILFWKHCPWIYLFCSHPIGLFDSDQLPPFLSDFPTESNPEDWEEFRQILHNGYFRMIQDSQRNLVKQLGYPPLPEEWKKTFPFFIHSPYLNLYQYPLEMDYGNVINISEKYFRVDSFCREEAEDEKCKDIHELLPGLPENFLHKDSTQKLIYVSMGSMGSCNLELMKHLINVFCSTKHLYFISLGPLYEQIKHLIENKKNMFGQGYLPQISILKRFHLDLAVIHGGNNSLTEIIQYGVPVIVMPLFYDQFLNGQRVEETEVGRKLDPFNFKDEELLTTINEMLENENFTKKVKEISKRINRDQSKVRCCERLEKLVNDFKNILPK